MAVLVLFLHVNSRSQVHDGVPYSPGRLKGGVTYSVPCTPFLLRVQEAEVAVTREPSRALGELVSSLTSQLYFSFSELVPVAINN